MHNFRLTFANRHVVLPVIHVIDEPRALLNAGIAEREGADGVFLVNHDIGHGRLLEIYDRMVERFPGLWVGVNCLDLRPNTVFAAVRPGTKGVWVDDARIDEESDRQPEAEAVRSAQARAGWQGLYFGGVAFKYQRQVEDLTAAAKAAAGYVDVVTTSGAGTGEAAAVEKIRVMKQALGTHPLAIASGVSPENVSDYLPHADCFLVATRVSRSFYDLDEGRVRALVRAVRAFGGGN